MFSNTSKPSWYDMETDIDMRERYDTYNDNYGHSLEYKNSQLAFVPPIDHNIKSPIPLVDNEDLNSYYSDCEEYKYEYEYEDEDEDDYSDIRELLPLKGSVFSNCNKMPIAKPLQSLIQKPVKVETRGRKPINKNIKKVKYNYSFKLTNEGKIITNKGLHFGRRSNHILIDDEKHREQRRKYALKKKLLSGH
jgi:hypothetical protein